jgi:HEAT repeat protein
VAVSKDIVRLSPLAFMVAVLGTALANASPSHAGEPTVVNEAGGSVVLKDGEKTLASFAPKTAKAVRGPATLRTAMASGHALLEVRIPVLAEGAKREEVWIAERAASGINVIWWNLAGARDADGETALVVTVSDRGVEEYQTAARLSRCDGAPVPLFRRTWDFASRGFRAAAPELPPRATTAVLAHRGGAPEGKPLGGFFFSSASGYSAGGGDAAKLKPPVAVNDGNPATVWTSDGEGRGQLLTARSSGGFPIIGLRVLTGDTSSEKSFRASAKPRRLSLIFGRDAAQNVEVDLVEDADLGVRRYREPYWVALPNPVTSTCVTVMIRESTSEKSPLSIADLDVLTVLDGPQAADRLVSDLAQGTSCVARQPLLVQLGAPALAKVAAAIVHAGPGVGRECLVAALAALVAAGTQPSAETASALVAALSRSTNEEERTVFKLLPGMVGAPVDAIAAVLADDKRPDEDRARAARVLANMGQTEARAALLRAVGRGGPFLRKSLRAVASGLSSPALATALAALEATPTGETGRRADLVLIAAYLAKREAELRPAALAALRARLHGAAPFEEQARAIQGLGLLRDPAANDALVDVRAHSADGVLRSLAVGELASAEGASVLPALRTALDDADPRVRETAAEGLGRRNDKSAAKAILEGAKQEPWPQVRRAEIVALGQLCVEEGNDLLVRAFQRDVEEVRQAALVGIAHCYQVKSTGTLLRTLGRLAESADMRSLAARLLGERKDPRTVPGLTEVLTRLRTESQADLSLEAVIADSAMALANIRSAEAISALVGLLSDTRASVQRIAVEALGVVCDPGKGAEALHRAATSKDEAVSIPASAAAANCRDRR